MRYTPPRIINSYPAVSAIQSDKNALQNEQNTFIPTVGPAYLAEE